MIENRFIFGEQEREQFRKVMRAQEAFSGVRVLTWNCMSNHFHVLVAVEGTESAVALEEKARQMEDDEAFLRRLGHLYDSKALGDVEKLLRLVRTGTGTGTAKADVGASAKGTDRQAPADDLAERGEVRRDTGQFLHPTLGRAKAGHDFVEPPPSPAPPAP